MTKEQLAGFKGKKVTFRKESAFPDIKVQFVDSFSDYEVKVSDSNSFSADIITYQEVTSFPDVKLKKVTAFGEFEIYFE